jgi:FkbH-like protein
MLRSYIDKCVPPYDHVLGWAYCVEDPTTPLQIELVIDRSVKASTLANRPRADLISAGLPPCAFAFLHQKYEPATEITIRAVTQDGAQTTIGVYEPPSDGAATQEPVRLLIWDLDDTFWKGTVSEGGIEEYSRFNHDIVRELAKRGILNSICSKNDRETVLQILAEREILDYFVFPSISWEPKGPRIAALIESAQLRPQTVMFLDDNPSNRAEAVAAVPGLQVESERFIARLLSDRRFIGKDDLQLSRLAKYKLLEKRQQDRKESKDTNEDFLRSSDIRVVIEYDVVAHIERVVELINRTNQLNFTKRRLPEDLEEATRILFDDLRTFSLQAGLVRVVDRYGDYGFVGFFACESLRAEHVAGAADRTLRHFCFSCRTLGMLVERWLYNHLGRPHLSVVGDVVTDVFAPSRIDWIRLVPSIDRQVATREPVAPALLIYGGCEANAIGVYLTEYSERVQVIGNFMSGALFVRINSARLALSTCSRGAEQFRSEAEALGLPNDLCTMDFFAHVPDGTAYVFSSGLDGEGRSRYKHKGHGWEIVLEPMGGPFVDFTTIAPEDLHIRLLARHHDEQSIYLKHIERVAKHIRANYVAVPSLSDSERCEALHEVVARLPVGSKMIFLLDHDQIRWDDGVLRAAPHVAHYNSLVKSVSDQYSFTGAVSFSDLIDSEEQVQVGGNHYHRLIYLRAAERLVEMLRTLPEKRVAPAEFQ